MGRTNGPSILPIKRRGRTRRPEAISSAAEQCAIIWATSILPHSCCVVGCSLSIRDITSSTASGWNRFFILITSHFPLGHLRIVVHDSIRGRPAQRDPAGKVLDGYLKSPAEAQRPEPF